MKFGPSDHFSIDAEGGLCNLYFSPESRRSPPRFQKALEQQEQLHTIGRSHPQHWDAHLGGKDDPLAEKGTHYHIVGDSEACSATMGIAQSVGMATRDHRWAVEDNLGVPATRVADFNFTELVATIAAIQLLATATRPRRKPGPKADAQHRHGKVKTDVQSRRAKKRAGAAV